MTQQTKLIQATREDSVGYEVGGKRYYDHTITVEGIDYHYDSIKPTLGETFQAGKEATFTTEEKPMKNGKSRLKIVPVRENPFKGKPAFNNINGYSKKDDGVIAMLSCISSASNYHQGRSTPFRDVLKDAQDAYDIVKAKRGDFN